MEEIYNAVIIFMFDWAIHTSVIVGGLYMSYWILRLMSKVITLLLNPFLNRIKILWNFVDFLKHRKDFNKWMEVNSIKRSK